MNRTPFLSDDAVETRTRLLERVAKAQRDPDVEYDVADLSALGGSLTYCPGCYPLVQFVESHFHLGDLSRDVPGGRFLNVYEGDERLKDVMRVYTLPDAPTLLLEMVRDDNGKIVNCPRCRVTWLRRLRFSDDIRVVFDDGFPDFLPRAAWLVQS